MGPGREADAVRRPAVAAWPAVTYERLSWESPNRDFGIVDRSARLRVQLIEVVPGSGGEESGSTHPHNEPI